MKLGALGLTVLLGLATLSGLVALLFPDLRESLMEHPLGGWSMAIVCLALALSFLILWGQALAEVSDLKKRLYPTEHDLTLFAEVEELLPLNRQTIPWLREAFNAKQWTEDQIEPLDAFHRHFELLSMDDSEAQTAFAALKAANDALLDWLSINGFVRDSVSMSRRMTYAVPPPDLTPELSPDEHNRRWQAYQDLRDTGHECAQRLVEARLNFHDAGRRRRLWRGSVREDSN